ncbi:MAG: hypothetical protein ACXABK_04340, partial [Candidatus Heimdallarchaeaceae archaeon]
MRKRVIFSIWIILFLLSVIPIIFRRYPNFQDMYVQIIALILPIISIGMGIYVAIRTEGIERRDISIIISVSIVLLLAYEIVREFFPNEPEGFFYNYWAIFWISAYFPFLTYAVRRIIQDIKYVTRAALVIGIAVTGLTTGVVSPIMSYFFDVFGSVGSNLDMRVFLTIMIIDFISFFVLNVLLVLYIQLRYGYYWILLVIGFGIFVFRDLAAAYSLLLEPHYPDIIVTVLNFIFYSTMIVGLITLLDPSFELRAVKDLDLERHYYKTRYVELEHLSKDLITVTELW